MSKEISKGVGSLYLDGIDGKCVNTGVIVYR